MRPAAIIRHLDLRKPIYRQLAAYGHLGREDLGVRWEDTDKAAELAKTLGRKVTPEELAREGEVTMEQITEAVRATGKAIEDIEYGQEEA